MSSDVREQIEQITFDSNTDQAIDQPDNQVENEQASPPETGNKHWKDLYRVIADYAKNLK